MLRQAVGLPCPGCGMTRAVALCLRGDLVGATFYHPLAIPLVLVALLFVMKWVTEFTLACRIDLVLHGWLGRYRVYVAGVIVVAAWVYLLTYRREDDFAQTWLGNLLGVH